MKRRLLIIFVLAATPFVAFAGSPYNISILGSPNDPIEPSPTTINNSQVVVGYDFSPGSTPLFLSVGASVSFSPPPANTGFVIQTMNDSSTAAGFLIFNPPGGSPPFYLAATYHNGQYTQLPAPDSNSASDYRAEGINNAGEVVGFAQIGDGTGRAVAWINQQPVFIDPNEPSSANAINDQGWIAGSITPSSANFSPIPVIWRDGVATAIPLPSMAIDGFSSAVNNAGQVLVTYTGVDGGVHANGVFWETRYLLWNNGVETLLPQFSDPTFGTFATSMNNSGVVVGNSANEAVIWEDGQIFKLNDLIGRESGWNLINAASINDAGDIVGLGTFDGVDMPFLLTPNANGSFNVTAPEPASASLLLLGTALLLRRNRRCGGI